MLVSLVSIPVTIIVLPVTIWFHVQRRLRRNRSTTKGQLPGPQQTYVTLHDPINEYMASNPRFDTAFRVT